MMLFGHTVSSSVRLSAIIKTAIPFMQVENTPSNKQPVNTEFN